MKHQASGLYISCCALGWSESAPRPVWPWVLRNLNMWPTNLWHLFIKQDCCLQPHLSLWVQDVGLEILPAFPSYLLDSLWQGAEGKPCARYSCVGSHLPSHPSYGFTLASIYQWGIQREWEAFLSHSRWVVELGFQLRLFEPTVCALGHSTLGILGGSSTLPNRFAQEYFGH